MPYLREAALEIERCCVEVRCARAYGGSFFVTGKRYGSRRENSACDKEARIWFLYELRELAMRGNIS
jgi:hypothetical protein